jgi:predicted amidohydrolase YtcJ
MIQKGFADTVLINGRIITVDANNTIVSALAIKDGKIIALGNDNQVKKLIGDATEIIDLRGLTATPGLIDTHNHFSMIYDLFVLRLGYPHVSSIAEIVKKVHEQAKIIKPGEWIQGLGWDEGALAEKRYILAGDLDPVTPNNPVWLQHTTGHYAVVNNCALSRAGITLNTPDPPGGTIDRYPDGTPTGVLKEAAKDLVRNIIPPFSDEQHIVGIKKMCQEFNREGMTAVKDGSGGIDRWKHFRDVLEKGDLTVRTFYIWRNLSGESLNTNEEAQHLIDSVASFTKPYITTGDDRLISGGVKLILDGSGAARTAWMYEPWNKRFNQIDKGNYGYTLFPGEKVYREIFKILHDSGLHVVTHAIGDRAIDWCVETIKMAIMENPVKGLRHGVIHCNVPTDKANNTMAWLQNNYDAGYPEAQAPFLWWIGDNYVANLGPERSLRLKPFKTWLNKGMIWGGGSDFPVTPFPARYGIWSSICRKTLLGTYGWNPSGMDESITVVDALRSYTIWAAHTIFMEDKIGSLETGKYADIAIWDKDMYSIPTEEIKDINCQMTLLEGKIAYINPKTEIKRVS